MCLFCPGELIALPEEFVEWHPLFSEPGDETAERGDASNQSLDPFQVPDGSHLLDGLDLLPVGLDPSVGDHEA